MENETWTIDREDLSSALAKLDIYVPGLSYDETADKILSELPRTGYYDGL